MFVRYLEASLDEGLFGQFVQGALTMCGVGRDSKMPQGESPAEEFLLPPTKTDSYMPPPPSLQDLERGCRELANQQLKAATETHI